MHTLVTTATSCLFHSQPRGLFNHLLNTSHDVASMKAILIF